MTEVVNYADAYQNAVQQAFYDGHLYSADLWNSPSNAMVKFDGAKHIKVPRLTITAGRQDRQRRTITNFSANYSNDWDSYEWCNYCARHILYRCRRFQNRDVWCNALL